jgi:malate synthase
MSLPEPSSTPPLGPLPTVLAPTSSAHATLLTPAALEFVGDLERRFRARRDDALARRAERQARFDAGERPGFLEHTRGVRAADWRVAPAPADLADRRVEITGPVGRKLIVNALNSGARVFMADFEDSCSPTWLNVIDGQLNLRDAVRRTIRHEDPRTGKRYELGPCPATLVVRPRGWHLPEKHVELDGRPVCAALFDFGLYFFHNAHELLRRGSGPYFYLPKLESHLEARLWNDVFLFAQRALGVPAGSIKATVLIETLPAAFEMDEILHELREHAAGLNCGRWDYIFSYLKTFRAHADHVLPDRADVGMERRFLRSYSRLLIRTCHRRGAHAIGGMAAQIPVKDDAARNAAALAKVRADKHREARAGHDGTWVAHPGLVQVARDEFDAVMPGPNQLALAPDEGEITADDLLAVPAGAATLAGLRQNLSIALRYTASWLCGNGCVPLEHLMEDAATAEISRAQVWQQVRHGVTLASGERVDRALVQRVLAQEAGALRAALGEVPFAAGRYPTAARLLASQILAEELAPFLTLEAYDHL